MTMLGTSLPWVQYNERATGQNHPDGEEDTVNRCLRQFLTNSGIDPDAVDAAIDMSEVVAEGSTESRSLQERFGEIKNILDYAGADFGAKIEAILTAFPSGGYTIDARGMDGAQSIASTLVIDVPYITLLLPAGFTLSAGSNQLSVQADGFTIEREVAFGANTLNGAYPQPGWAYTGTGSAIVVGDGTAAIRQFVAINLGIDIRAAGTSAVGLELKAVMYFTLDRLTILGSLAAGTVQTGLVVDGNHASLFAGWGLILNPVMNRVYRGIRSTGTGVHTGNAITLIGGSMQGANNYASGTAGRGLWLEAGKRWFVVGLDIDNFEAGVYCESSNHFIIFSGENNDTDIVCTSSSSGNEIRDVRGSTNPSDAGTSNLVYQGTTLKSNFTAEGLVHTFGGSAGASLAMQIKAAASTTRSLVWSSANIGVWRLTVNGTESGSNAGALWGLYAYDDSGTLIDAPLTVVRVAGGAITFNRPITANFDISLASGKVLKVNGTQVVAARSTGWTAMTGTSNKNTSYDVSTITLPQLAARVAAIQEALTTHGMIGA